jgi:glutamate N-acetyltransferase/amino-acid N-acetyltransferase
VRGAWFWRAGSGLLVSERPCDAAAVFTRNAFKGAPLGVTREAVEAGGLRAVVVNSGNANAATGARGVEDAYAMQGAAGEALGVEAGRVAVASTGVIGEHLPMDRVTSGIREASAGLSGDGTPFAEAILTTDTRTRRRRFRSRSAGRPSPSGGRPRAAA